KALTLQSVNGPAVTIIRGFQVPNQSAMNTNGYKAIRCAYLTNGAVLIGFTLTNGGVWTISRNSQDQSGGGTWCETSAIVSNCVITANSAYYTGGGVYQGTYFSCVLLSNSVSIYGGGAFNSTLNGCTLIGNRQQHPNIGGGGGAYSSVLNNCTLTNNYSAANDTAYGGGGVYASTLTNCTLSGNSAAYDGGA